MRGFIEETRVGRYVAYFVALVLVAAVWAGSMHRADQLTQDAIEKEQRATRAIWPMYARMLIDCMKGKGFATKDLAVQCYPTHVISPEGE